MSREVREVAVQPYSSTCLIPCDVMPLLLKLSSDKSDSCDSARQRGLIRCCRRWFCPSERARRLTSLERRLTLWGRQEGSIELPARSRLVRLVAPAMHSESSAAPSLPMLFPLRPRTCRPRNRAMPRAMAPQPSARISLSLRSSTAKLDSIDNCDASMKAASQCSEFELRERLCRLEMQLNPATRLANPSHSMSLWLRSSWSSCGRNGSVSPSSRHPAGPMWFLARLSSVRDVRQRRVMSESDLLSVMLLSDRFSPRSECRLDSNCRSRRLLELRSNACSEVRNEQSTVPLSFSFTATGSATLLARMPAKATSS
eukprot:706492-Hanusia_phi.AAC.3